MGGEFGGMGGGGAMGRGRGNGRGPLPPNIHLPDFSKPPPGFPAAPGFPPGPPPHHAPVASNSTRRWTCFPPCPTMTSLPASWPPSSRSVSHSARFSRA